MFCSVNLLVLLRKFKPYPSICVLVSQMVFSVVVSFASLSYFVFLQQFLINSRKVVQ